MIVERRAESCFCQSLKCRDFESAGKVEHSDMRMKREVGWSITGGVGIRVEILHETTDGG